MLREKAGSKEYSLYGLFLIRQGREKESMELFKMMKEKKDMKSDSEKNIKQWKQYLNSLSFAKGEEKNGEIK